jgi:hypothetical protein
MRTVTDAARLLALPGVVRLTEADRTHNQTRELLQAALKERFGAEDNYVWVRDVADEWVVYDLENPTECDTLRIGYTISDDNVVALATGDPEKVVATTTYERISEAREQIPGRVVEAVGTDDAGGRVFRMEILRYGLSLNGVNYTPEVIADAVRLYEGSKAFDHHRSPAELESSTIDGLVGQFRNVQVGPFALEGDLHLLPGATHTAEALQASLESQAAGGPPLVGVSHDVAAEKVPKVVGGRRIQEATRILHVFSVDVVADASAGGRATRLVAGGSEGGSSNTPLPKPTEDTVTLKQLLELLRKADAAARAELLKEHASVLTDNGLTEDDVAKLVTAEPPPPPPPAGEGNGAGTGEGGERELELVGAATVRESHVGRMLVREAVATAGLDNRFVERVTRSLPERFTDADLTRQVESFRDLAEAFERGSLTPRVGHVTVTEEDRDKKVDAVARTLEGAAGGYPGIKAMYADVTGASAADLLSGELPFEILRECFNTGRYEGRRVRESVDTATFGQILGDALHRRMVAEYGLPSLQTWREIVSSIVPRNDFRTNRVTRMGGYGTLPDVSQSAPYQPLTTPGDEEATYAIGKKGGLEDLTMESIANDDLGALQRIPRALGRAAVQTLYRFVWDLLRTNAAIYDAVALFHANHANTDAASALSQSTLSVGRRKMRQQTAYGDASEVLSIVPKYLVVPSALEEIAFQLCTSAVAIPGTPAGPTDTPNIHQGTKPIVVDYFSDDNDWFLVGDPAMVPTIELGFYQGKQDPELFVQDDPRVGSVFTADKITWKIRHIYSGTVLDYRGFYRGQG